MLLQATPFGMHTWRVPLMDSLLTRVMPPCKNAGFHSLPRAATTMHMYLHLPAVWKRVGTAASFALLLRKQMLRRLSRTGAHIEDVSHASSVKGSHTIRHHQHRTMIMMSV